MSPSARPAVPEAIANLAAQVTEAAERIRQVVVETPVERIEGLAREYGSVFLKLENLQKTGSFKLRGASNKILSLSPGQAAQGVIAASNGNHGLGVAAAARETGIAAEVYVSNQVSRSKVRRIQEYGARIQRIGNDPLEASWPHVPLRLSKARYSFLLITMPRLWRVRAASPLNCCVNSRRSTQCSWQLEAVNSLAALAHI